MIGISFIDAQKRYSDPRTNLDEKKKLKPLLDSIKAMYPQKLSEAEPSKKQIKLYVKVQKNKKGLPAISTASLPDIVFMLLFFFMVATVMRDSTLMVKNTLPAADQVQKLDKKDRVMYIYAGKPSIRYQDKYGTHSKNSTK